MKLVLIVVGKTDKEWIIRGLTDYTERLEHFAHFQTIVIPDIKNTKNMDSKTQKEFEGDAIIKQLMPGDDIILLDEKGIEMTSAGMAEWMQKRMSASSRRIVFIIGGPYGFSEKV